MRGFVLITALALTISTSPVWSQFIIMPQTRTHGSPMYFGLDMGAIQLEALRQHKARAEYKQVRNICKVVKKFNDPVFEEECKGFREEDQ